ncbi:hypothetical protein DAMNIGENAA_38060 [Desulforhabdus amnigena]|jgi:hypothetical protein|uniref:Uncharacterized protein n=1 Tax=Desulforhabdus amnigena TaxID=40218 RepID=A0A9W6L988_9BACT|nr:hypothetical protein DAMNIGENAA_38060 [Desulforhabdus amnigena]
MKQNGCRTGEDTESAENKENSETGCFSLSGISAYLRICKRGNGYPVFTNGSAAQGETFENPLTEGKSTG